MILSEDPTEEGQETIRGLSLLNIFTPIDMHVQLLHVCICVRSILITSPSCFPTDFYFGSHWMSVYQLIEYLAAHYNTPDEVLLLAFSSLLESCSERWAGVDSRPRKDKGEPEINIFFTEKPCAEGREAGQSKKENDSRWRRKSEWSRIGSVDLMLFCFLDILGWSSFL